MSGTLAYGSPVRIQEVKAAADGAWECQGYVSTYDLDLGNDQVRPGAFTKTLAAGTPVRFLYAHDHSQVLGTPLSLKEDDRGLFGRFRISKTRLGQDVHTLLQDGALDSFSIGYLPDEFEIDKKSGVRHLTSLSLVECSLVALPMNPAAVVTGVKTADYSAMRLDAIVQTLGGHRAAALAAAKALVRRRWSEGRKLSDRTMELLEAWRAAASEDADELLALLTTPPPEREDKGRGPEQDAQDAPPPPSGPESDPTVDPTVDPTPTPAAVRTAGHVEAFLRHRRIARLARKFADVPLPEYDELAHLERLPVPGQERAAP